jgi:hypothetical protein
MKVTNGYWSDFAELANSSGDGIIGISQKNGNIR